MIVNYFYMIIVMIKDWLSVSSYREFMETVRAIYV